MFEELVCRTIVVQATQEIEVSLLAAEARCSPSNDLVDEADEDQWTHVGLREDLQPSTARETKRPTRTRRLFTTSLKQKLHTIQMMDTFVLVS